MRRRGLIAALKGWAKRHWPRLRLRTILFATLFFVAALPGVGAIFLRVYENTLVRQTEAELVAQGVALAAAAEATWPGAQPVMPARDDFAPEPPRIDLNATPILPERPDPAGPATAPTPDAEKALTTLAPVIADTRRTTLASIILLDGQGRALAGPQRGLSFAALPEVRAAMAGNAETVLRRNGAYRQIYWFEWLSRAAAIRVHHARPIVVDGRIVGVLLLSRSARALFKGMYEDRGKIAVGVVGIFLILIVLSGVLSRGIARPIEALSAVTRSVAAGRGAVPEVPATAAIEIQGLYRDFAVMAAAIDRRSRYLRDFAHAVSHEFKTPLAGIRGAIELLQDHDATMAEADRRRFLANADADAGRLATLVTRLLDLARADMARSDTDAATDIAPIMAKVADAARSEVLMVTISAVAALSRAAIPATTLEAVLTTLIENSRQAGADAVSLDATTSGDTIMLDVADNGPGVAEADRDRIFEPFFTTHRAEGGTGLGLPIVRSLLEAAGASITLAGSSAGAVFRLCLPVAGLNMLSPTES